MKNKSWIETHYEVVQEITSILSDPNNCNYLVDIIQDQGHAGLYDLAEEITDCFERLNINRVWDGEFLEEIVKFTQDYCQYKEPAATPLNDLIKLDQLINVSLISESAKRILKGEISNQIEILKRK